jgi:hypothetical protein
MASCHRPAVGAETGTDFKYPTTFLWKVSLFLLSASVSVVSQVAQVHYGSWMPMKDSESNGIQIAFKLYPDGMMYYKLKNTYPYVAKVSCQFRFIDRKGKSALETGCSATLAPGQEKTNGGWWDANVASVDSSSLAAKVGAADAAQPDRKTSSLVYSTCDPSPDSIELGCNQKKAQCNKNIYSWCELQFGKEGTQKNRDYCAQYDKCVTSHLADCVSSQSQCVSHIRRCGDGQSCDARTDTCSVSPR